LPGNLSPYFTAGVSSLPAFSEARGSHLTSSEGPAKGKIPLLWERAVHNHSNNEWATVANAARILGVSKQAIRQRVYRDTIPHTKDENGVVYIRVTQPNDERQGESNAVDNAVLLDYVETLKDRMKHLEEESSRKDHIIMSLTQRLPELEAPASGPLEARETDRRISTRRESSEVPNRQQGAKLGLRGKFIDWIGSATVSVLMGPIIGGLIAIPSLVYTGVSVANGETIVSLLSAAFGVIAAVVGVYWGIKTSSDATDETARLLASQEKAARAASSALAADSQVSPENRRGDGDSGP
jgi:hypothetical protein